MPRATGKGKYRKGAVHEADDSAIIKDKTDLEDVDLERKDAYMKRVRDEDVKNKEIYAKSGGYLTIEGYKVLIRFQNSTGSEYTRYWFNGKRHPEELEQVKKQGYGMAPMGGDKVEKLPLKFVNGRPYKGV